jgi:predicted regulator of Ras-like GTPase activity (Roadblock/LC7/MglB family)
MLLVRPSRSGRRRSFGLDGLPAALLPSAYCLLEIFMADLDETLNSFTRVRGVTAALIVGQDGLVLQSATAQGADDVDTDVLGAVASSGLLPAQEIGGQTGRGMLRQGIYEYEKGVVVLEPIGQSAILVVVTSATANLGLLRLQARKVHPDLEAALTGL